MPFLPDGTPVDIVLNPLGVPSRMNVGQILETHLGWAARILGFDAKTPVFQGADETEIGVLLRLAGLTWAAEALRLDQRLPALDADAVRQIAQDLRRLEQAFHEARGAGDEAPAKDQAALKAGVKEIERLLQRDAPASVLEACGLPALAALLGLKSEVDLDQAVNELLGAAGLSPAGKARLRDGRSGDVFTSDVTVGSIYMMKLSHLVDDKIHARSIGPYSLVTQQPLAGKAQFGGQRFGEMEVWALEAYGAAHTLQEILTVKSDDVNGRSRVYEAIVKGQNLPKPGIPESFNVLVKELQALGLKVTLGTTEDVEE